MFGPVRLQKPCLLPVEVGVVGNESTLQGPVEDRVPPFPNLQEARLIEDGPHEPSLLRERRERGEGVELPDGPPQSMKAGHVGLDGLQEPLPRRRLFVRATVPGAQDAGLGLGQLVGREPLRVREGLLPPEVGGDAAQVRSGHLEVVPEHLVVPDLQAPDPSGLLLTPFQGFELGEPLPLDAGERVEVGRVPGAEQPPCSIVAGGSSGRARAEQFAKLGERIEPGVERLEERGAGTGLDRRRASSTAARLSRIAPSSGGRTRRPATRLAMRARSATGRRAARTASSSLPRGPERLDGVEPCVDGGKVRERLAEPERQGPATRGRDGHVPRRQERRAGDVVGVHRAGDLEVTQGLRIQQEPAAHRARLRITSRYGRSRGWVEAT